MSKKSIYPNVTSFQITIKTTNIDKKALQKVFKCFRVVSSNSDKKELHHVIKRSSTSHNQKRFFFVILLLN